MLYQQNLRTCFPILSQGKSTQMIVMIMRPFNVLFISQHNNYFYLCMQNVSPNYMQIYKQILFQLQNNPQATSKQDCILAVVLYALLSVQACTCKYEWPCGSHRSAITVYIALRERLALSIAPDTVYAPFSLSNHSTAGCLKSAALCHQHNPTNLEAERSTYKYCKGIKITQINLSKHQVLS